MRLLIMFVLIVAVATTTAGRPPIIKGDPPSGEQENELTPEEKKAARELTVRFMKRLEATADFAPLVGEFFFGDFTERFKRFVRDMNIGDGFLRGIQRRVLLQATQDDLRRCYVALMNFWNQYSLLNNATGEYIKHRSKLEHQPEPHGEVYWELDKKVLENALTPGFFAVAESDPLLMIVVNQVYTREQLTDPVKRVEAAAISSVERLRFFTEKLERCVALMREGVRKLQVEEEQQSDSSVTRQRLGRDYDRYIYRVEYHVFEKKTAGFPAGTRLISVRIFPYVVTMTRLNGPLKIIAVLPDFDGD